MRVWTILFVFVAACDRGPGPPCGDGVLDWDTLGEECELCDGYSIRWGSCEEEVLRLPLDSCLASCETAPPRCGDGIVEGGEVCELCGSDLPADDIYGYCPGLFELAPGSACVDCQIQEVGAGIEVIVSGPCAGDIEVTSDPPGIVCGTTCMASFEPGTSVRMDSHAPNGTRTTWGGDCIGVDGQTSPYATIVASAESQTCTVECEGMVETGFYVSLPFVPTITSTGTILRLTPEAFDGESVRPVTEVFSDIAACEWRVERDGEVIAMTTIGPSCMLELGQFTEIPLERGFHYVFAVVERTTGERSIEAATGFTVDIPE